MFYKLKLKDSAKDSTKSIFGVTVQKDVSVYIETERNLLDELAKKRVSTVEATVVETVPERGEDGNAPRFVDFGDEPLRQ